MIPYSLPITILLILYFCSKQFIIFYLLINYIAAVIIYSKLSKYYYPRMKSEKQYYHEDFPSFNRIELYSLTFSRIYYGMLNYYWIKATLAFGALFTLWLRLKIHFRGRNLSKTEFTKEDVEFLHRTSETLVKQLYVLMGVTIKEENYVENPEVLKVYRKYLGVNYNPINKFTTVICNHCAWVEIFYLQSKNTVSFVSKDSIVKIPLVGYIAQAYKCLLINRASQDSRVEVLNKIAERQKDVQEGKTTLPLVLFPEGTTGSGRNILTFKKGAFYTLTPVKIFLLKMNTKEGHFPLSASVMNVFLHICVTLTFNQCYLTAYELPVFAPNDYLFENFSHLGKDKAEIFAEATRLIMSEVGQLPLSHSDFQTKLTYLSLTKNKVIKNT